MLFRAQFNVMSYWVTFATFRVTSSAVLHSQEDNNIIWNGCESEAMMNIYNTFTVDKPQLCLKRLPDYLDGVEPQQIDAPYLVQAIINKEILGDILITIHAKSAMFSEDTKTRQVDLNFESVLISSQTPEKSDVGQFYIRADGIKDYYDIGYCCGQSRNIHNFYQFHSYMGHPSTAVAWTSLNHKGPVLFNVTVIQNLKTFWHLPPYMIVLD